MTGARIALVLCAAALLACGAPAPSGEPAAGTAPPAVTTPPDAAATAPDAAPPASASPASSHLRIDGTTFRTPEGAIFQWRGITALRLLDHLADGRDAEVEAFLAWCARRRLTVVRTLAMGGDWLNLTPEQGRAALPRLLELARTHGLFVEVVGLATTIVMPVDLDAQIGALGTILAGHPNALLELANEPVHPTQAPQVGKPDVLAAIAGRLPPEVPVSLGSVEENPGFARGNYVTWHAPRDSGRGGWGHVLRLAQGAEFLARFRKPVISDEPIGAGPAFEPGRRDNAPERFRAAALMTRLVGMGATFHYGAGLEARIPDGVELRCFDAWDQAWTLLPPDVESTGTFRAAATEGAAVAAFDGQAVHGVFERTTERAGWVLSVGTGEPAVRLAEGWQVEGTQTFDGGRLLRITRPRSSRNAP